MAKKKEKKPTINSLVGQLLAQLDKECDAAHDKQDDANKRVKLLDGALEALQGVEHYIGQL